MTFTSGQIVEYVQSLLWPFLRVIGLFLAAPIFSAAIVPARVKVILALTLAFLIAPLAQSSVPVEPLGARMLLIAANQILIGVVIGFAVQIVFEALSFAGQTVAMTMGLGYATLIDPQRGAAVPVVSQFLLVLGILMFLSLDGHLALIRILAESFHWMPVADTALPPDAARGIANWGGRLFEAGLVIGFPAIVALIVVNLALGVVSRAAPTLNLFAVGFPVSLGIGFLIVMLSLFSLQDIFSDLLRESFEAVRSLLSMRSAPNG